jgi:hypothetical protein
LQVKVQFVEWKGGRWINVLPDCSKLG